MRRADGWAKEVGALLGRVALRDDDSLAQALAALRERCGPDAVGVFYTLEQREGGLHVPRLVGSGNAPSLRGILNEYLSDKLVGWSGFNPLAPDPAQRNVVLRERDLRASSESSPVEREVYPRAGMAGFGTVRILLCDGPQFLAWLGVLAPGPAADRTRRALRLVAPAFRARARTEHLLQRDTIPPGALDAAVEAIGSAVFLVDDRTRVLCANELARRRLDADALATIQALRDSVRTRDARAPYRVTPVVDAGARACFLAVARSPEQDASERARRASQRLGLTPRETEVALLVARGLSNRALSVRLRVAERTVEAHLTSILSKAQVESRAGLVAVLLA